jgi:hypothetical protein
MSVSLLAFASWFFLEKKKTSSWLVSLWLPFGLAVTSNIVLDEPLCVSYRIHHKRVLDLSGPFCAGLSCALDLSVLG